MVLEMVELKEVWTWRLGFGLDFGGFGAEFQDGLGLAQSS